LILADANLLTDAVNAAAAQCAKALDWLDACINSTERVGLP
jgi:hypothetical protein